MSDKLAEENSELPFRQFFRSNGVDTGLEYLGSRSDSPNFQSIGISPASDRYSPRLRLPCMTPERRDHVLKVLRRSIPMYAAAKRRIIQENASYAKLCIQDAFAGRLSNGLATNSKKSWWIYTLFRIQTSEWLFNCVVTASVLHTFSIFFETPNTCAASWLYYAFQILILLVYAIDIALKMTYEGPKEYFKHDWQRLYVLNLIFHVLDLAFCGCTFYANPLRPVAGVLRDRRGRKFFEVLKKMVPEMLHNMVPILFFVMIVMVFCSSLYDAEIPDFKDTSYTFYNWWFLVLTNDNFSRLLPDRLYRSLTYLLYFFPGIYIGQRFLLNLIIGDTYGTFRAYVKKQLDKERLKELQGLTKAFAALDDEGTGRINLNVWTACIQHYLPDLPHEATALYFELISGGEDHITVLQFLNLRSVLNFKLYFHSHSKNRFLGSVQKWRDRCIAEYNNVTFAVPKIVQEYAQHALDHAVANNYLARANFVDILLLSSGFSEYVFFTVSQFNHAGVTLCQIVCIVHLLEYIVRFLASGGRPAAVTDQSNFISYGFTLGTVVCLGYYPVVQCLQTLQWISSSDAALHALSMDLPWIGPFTLSGDKVLLIMRLLRCLRLANLNQDLKNFNAAIFDVFPALVETFSLTFIVTYIFGLLGHLLLGSSMHEWSTPLLAVVKAQQLTFMVNFLDSMEDAMAQVSPLTIVYFLTFLILSLTVSNIALSIIIDLHANVLDMKTNKDRAGMRKKIDNVFEKMVDKARQRQVTGILMGSARQKSLNFKSIRISEFQSSDVRKFITNHGSDGLKLSELEKCNAQSNINLVDFYNAQHRHHKDLNKDVDFIQRLHEAGFKEVNMAHGEVLFEAGQVAKKLFYLVKGSVVLQRVRPTLTGSTSQGQVSTPHPIGSISQPSSSSNQFNNSSGSNYVLGACSDIFHALLFLGAEALEPTGVYQHTCIAEHETLVFVFEHDDIVHGMEADIAGELLQQSFKSHVKIETTFADTRRLSVKRRRHSMLTGQSSVDTPTHGLLVRHNSGHTATSSSPRSSQSTPINTAR